MKQAEEIKKQAEWRFSWRLLWENFVFQEWNHFFKMPTALYRHTMYKHTDSYEKVLDAMRLIKKYFGPMVTIPKTEILKDKNANYVIKQEKIPWEKLTKKYLENNPKLLSKFSRIIVANEMMWKQEWFFLDLLGSDIVKQPNTIHNLFTDWDNIYIFDFWLLEQSSKNIFFKYFSRFWTWFQLKFMKRFF